MTINLSDNDPRVSYAVAEGVTQSSFTVSFEFFNDEDLNVYVDGTLKTLISDYTVTGGDGSTGTVTISVTGASGGSTVVITRSIDLERTTDFPSSGAFNIDSLNTELDRFVAINADLKDQIDRSLKLTDYDTAVALTLPEVNDRKGTVLAFNSTTGAVEAGPTTSNVNTLADISDDIATLADIEDGTDATDAIQTVAGISSDVTTVSGISSNVATVAGISANVTTVAGDSADIQSVAADAANIGTVATNIADVNTAATNITDIQNASTNAATATTKAAEAATSATNAATSATAAAASQVAAANSAASAAAAFDNFDDTYLGSKASDPTVDNDGDALNAGDLYFNTTSNVLKVYNGSAWQDAAVDASSFIATSGGTLTGNLNYNDSVKAQFGAGNDLEIYHDGSNSIIDETGTGDLQIKVGGTTKLSTSSTGITVTGTAVATTDTDTTNSGSVTLDFGANQNFVLTLTGNVTLANPTTEQVGQSGFIVFIQDATGGRTVSLDPDYKTAGGAGINLSSAASATDVVPYIVAASGQILLGTPQLAFA